jgi:hypothetical protein
MNKEVYINQERALDLATDCYSSIQVIVVVYLNVRHGTFLTAIGRNLSTLQFSSIFGTSQNDLLIACLECHTRQYASVDQYHVASKLNGFDIYRQSKLNELTFYALVSKANLCKSVVRGNDLTSFC